MARTWPFVVKEVGLLTPSKEADRLVSGGWCRIP